MRDMAFRVTSLLAEDASTPAYQALTTVLSKPKARIAMETPRTVKNVLSLWRNEFLKISLRTCIQDTFVKMFNQMSHPGSPGIMGHHDDCFTEFMHEALHELKDLYR